MLGFANEIQGMVRKRTETGQPVCRLPRLGPFFDHWE